MVGDYLSDLPGRSPELVARAIPAKLFDSCTDEQSSSSPMIASSRKSDVIRRIGVAVAIWLADPRKHHFEKLSDLVKACLVRR